MPSLAQSEEGETRRGSEGGGRRGKALEGTGERMGKQENRKYVRPRSFCPEPSERPNDFAVRSSSCLGRSENDEDDR